jgi:hypothetical protein
VIGGGAGDVELAQQVVDVLLDRVLGDDTLGAGTTSGVSAAGPYTAVARKLVA